MRSVRNAARESVIEQIGGFKGPGDAVIGAAQNPSKPILRIAADANDRAYS
jgi:hypothetical protein